MTLVTDVTNLLGDVSTTTLTRADTAANNGAFTGFTATYPRLVHIEESTFSLGVRFHF